MDLQDNFKYSRIQGPSDCSKCSCSEARVSRSKWWGVGHVERFGAELRPELFADRKCFTEHDVQRSVSWTNDRISRAVADGELLRLREGTRVEPSRGAPLFRRKLRIGYPVRPLDSE